ncbi:MAG TPA: TerB family tellurite resistance protein [Cyclobacteriaceae bacterium]|nr:TerB family tellurite resistance protein [Cyclobacteriaceae bacterium]
MKKIRLIVLFLLVLGCTQRSFGQLTEAQQLLLNWEKLRQLEEILDNMYKGYKILDKGYTTIRNIAEGNYTIHELFIDGLMMVNPSVRNYKRIPSIIDYQKLLLKEYQRAYNRFRHDPNFSLSELEYLGNVYSFLFDASLRNLDELMMVITATKLSMSDDERMQAIDRIFFDMEDKLIFLRTFNNNTQLLAIQRARSINDVNTLRQLYDIN